MVVQESASDEGESSGKGDKKHRLKQRFDVRQKLGQGTYGKVQLALNRETGQEVAIKTIKKSKIESDQDLIRIRREIQIMSSIQHPHIIHIYEVFENKDKIVLVMQFASGGELYDYLSEKKVLSDLEARRIFRQIAAAVYYCHKNKICHRDLKLENILLDEKGNAKIADFGLSNVFDERHLLKTYCGSPLYASPEIVKGVPYYGPEVDCWSMGVLLYTLVYGAMPFDGSNFKKLVTQISEGDYFEPKKKSKASELIHRLLAVNPLKRATIVDICTDFWVNQGYEHSLLQVAEDLAELTPVRLDLLLALAPSSPVPPEDLRERLKEGSEDELMLKSQLNKEAEDEDDDDDEEEEVPETMVNSFAFVRGSQVSNFSASSPDLQQLAENERYREEEFLPSGLAAALEGQSAKRAAERSFDGSLMHVSSMAHKSKKTRKSDSIAANIPQLSTQSSEEKSNSQEQCDNTTSEANESLASESENNNTPEKTSVLNDLSKVQSDFPSKDNLSKQTEVSQNIVRKGSSFGLGKSNETLSTISQNSNVSQEKDVSQEKRVGRAPGKIVIPKTFETPQSTPSPKAGSVKTSPTITENKCLPEFKPEIEGALTKPTDDSELIKTSENKEPEGLKSDSSSSETIGKVINVEPISEEKKLFAKGILKKGIAKAKLAERRLSQQSSTESEVAAPSSASVKTSDNVPSFYKTPKPYIKEDEQQVKSKAEIILSSAKTCGNSKATENVERSAPLWDSVSNNQSMKQMQNRNLSWGTISSTLDSEMSGWKEQMEESLRRLSPDGSAEKSVSSVNTVCRDDDDKPLVPIARSYKKFTFTKDGACITETKKIYTTPGADGSWTKVEKKTKITTRPGNAEEFERFRDLHMRNDSPLMKSDSQSSSGSNEVYDDIFDSWTGDTMMCNMMKIKNMFHKFSQDPFMQSDRRRNPFRNFRRTESDRNERVRRRPELRSGHSTDNEENDCDITFDGTGPVMYGSQGLWQFLKSPNKRMPRCVVMAPQDRSGFTRSVSQDRSGSKINNWKHCESRASSGYNTSSRSQSPHEKVLRFVFESPSQDYESVQQNRRDSSSHHRSTPRRDSGVNSDGYESEQFYRRAPSDDFSKSGRVSPISSTYSSGRQGMMREFVKSWPKEMLARHSMTNEATDSRRNKVEQWLHMNDMNNENFPFSFYSDSPARLNSRKTSIHDNMSSAYATMRPREYMKYTRSSSDKVSDSNIDFTAFEDGSRLRSMLGNQNLEQDALKSRARSTTYSPVSEESSREARSLRHSDSSHSSTSVHHINFTFSDGRAATSQSTSPQSAIRHIQLGGYENDRRTEGNTISVEQLTPKSCGQPIVQMRVSFNRGSKEKVLQCSAQSPPSSIGLWQHQDQLNPPKPCGTVVREISPIPGIKKFSTEMVHTVGHAPECQGTAEKSRGKHLSGPASIECDIKAKSNSHKGKLHSRYSPSVCSEAHSDACSDSCMESARKNTNLNLYPQFSPSSSYCNDSRTMFKQEYDACKLDPADVNTPDSLEDSNFDLSSTIPMSCPEQNSQPDAVDNLQLDIKPLGVLWNNYGGSNFGTLNQSEKFPVPPRSPDNRKLYSSCEVRSSVSDKDANARSPKLRGSPFTEIGSIWEQRNNNCQTFDLIKELLSDEGLDNMVSGQCIHKPAVQYIQNDGVPHKLVTTKESEILKMGVSPLSMLDSISVIDCQMDKTAQAEEIGGLLPSLMDDLQSPKKVLHQALRIGNFLKTCE